MESAKTQQEDLKNIIICEWVQKETGLPTHLIEILTTTEDTSNIIAKQKLKTILKDLKISKFFELENKVFEGSKHQLLKVNNIGNQASNLVLTQNMYEDTFVLNLFLSQFDEVEISDFNKEIATISQALSGSFKRTEFQKESGLITSAKQEEELVDGLSRLGRFFQWEICEEFSLRGGKESVTITPMITSAVLLKAYILKDLQECVGQCGKAYPTDLEKDSSTCECGGDIILSPPKLKFENISFVYPDGLEEIFKLEEASPMNIYKLILNALIPRNLWLKLNQVHEFKFENTLTIPSMAYFRFDDINDTLRIFFDYEIIEDNDILIFASITDTRYNDPRLQSSISLPRIRKDIKNGLKDRIEFEEIIKKTELREWNVTPSVKIKELTKIESFNQLESLFSKSGDVIE